MSISKKTGVVRWSWYASGSTFQNWSEPLTVSWMAKACTWGKDDTRMHYENKAIQQMQSDVLGNALLGNLASWCSCGCYFDTYNLPKHSCRSNITYRFIAIVFPNCYGLFQQDDVPCHTVKTAQEWFKRHDKGLQIKPDLNPIEGARRLSG